MKRLGPFFLVMLASAVAFGQSTITGVIKPYSGGSVTATTGSVRSSAPIDQQGNFSIPVISNPNTHLITFVPQGGSAYSQFSITITAGPGVTNITAQAAAAIPPPVPYMVAALQVNTAYVTINGVQYVFPMTQASGALCNDGSGNLSWTGCGGGGSSGFPITIGSTTFAANSSHAAVTGLTVNGVILDNAGPSTQYLGHDGNYTTPPGKNSAGANTAVQASDGSGGFQDSGCTAASGAHTCTSYTATGTKFPFQSNSASNTDLNGHLTMTGGTASYSFASTGITTAPECTASDATAVAAVQVVTSTTTLTINGTAGDVAHYICSGHN